jgi:hypothetical protein
MEDTKNRAILYHKGESFIIYQDKHDKWVYTYEALANVNTQSKSLQTALNLAYETINDSISSSKGRKALAKKTKLAFK